MATSKADAPFVFEGAVKALAESGVAAIPAGKNTAIVTVHFVRSAPRALAGMEGKDVTLRLGPNEKLKAGDERVFFTEGLIFDENVGLQSLGFDPVPNAGSHLALSAATAGISRPVRELRSRVDTADTVVSGKVSEIRELAVTSGTPAKALTEVGKATTQPTRARVSEHEPFWCEAVIDVSKVHKGKADSGKVVVRFPDSSDVRWHLAPKFKVGQSGTWLLRGDGPVTGEPKALAKSGGPGAAKTDTYTCLSPADFHPEGATDIITAMLPGSGPAATAPTKPKKASRPKSASVKTDKKSPRRKN